MNEETERSVWERAELVDSLVDRIRPLLRVDGAVLIKGRIVDCESKYAGWHFGTIKGAEAAIRFRSPKTGPQPMPGSNLVLRGTVAVQPHRFKDGLEVLLTGEFLLPVPASAPQCSGTPLALRKSPTVRRLSSLFASDPTPTILLIATQTAVDDAASAASRHGITPSWVVTTVSFAGAAQIHEAISSQPSTSFKAIAFLRGGGEQMTLDLWNDPAFVSSLASLDIPFFTALGHASNLFLADRLADECFETPTAFGAAYAQHSLAAESADVCRRERDEALRKCEIAKRDAEGRSRQHEIALAQRDSALASVQVQLGEKETSITFLRRVTIVFGLLLLAAAALLLSYLVMH